MNAELIERSDVYNVTYKEEQYTLYVTESNSYCEYHVADSEGRVMDADFEEEFMNAFWEIYSEIEK